MVTILDPTKMYLPTMGGPTGRKRQIIERSKHKHAVIVPSITENNPSEILPPQTLDGEEIKGFKVTNADIFRANTLDHIPSSPDGFGTDVYESRFAMRSDAVKTSIMNVHQNIQPGDVIQGNHFLDMALGASAAAKALDLPFVYQLHAPISGFIDRNETSTKKRIQNEIKQGVEAAIFRGGKFQIADMTFDLKAPDHVINISELTKQHLMGAYKLQNKDVSVVVNGIDKHDMLDVEANQQRIDEVYKKYGIPQDGFTIAYAGAIDELNGVKILLEAIDNVVEGQNVNIHFALGGKDRKGLLEPYKDKPWLTNALFKPEEVELLYAGSDILAMPRLDMGAADTIVPLKPIEALQAGAGLLLSNRVALYNTFKDAAVFVESGDRHGLEKQLYTLATEGYPQDLKNNATKVVQEYPLWNNVVDVYDNVFTNIANR